jgi:hypothetical protein
VEPLAVATAIQVAYVIGLIALLIGPVTIAELKGQDWLVGASWLTKGISCWIGMFRLATPESWWARHFYGPKKMARAVERYAWEDE